MSSSTIGFQSEMEGQVPDAAAVRLSARDKCWRMVLGTLKEKGDKPAFSQGGLQQFRERLVRHEMDLRLLERTTNMLGHAGRKIAENLQMEFADVCRLSGAPLLAGSSIKAELDIVPECLVGQMGIVT